MSQRLAERPTRQYRAPSPLLHDTPSQEPRALQSGLRFANPGGYRAGETLEMRGRSYRSLTVENCSGGGFASFSTRHSKDFDFSSHASGLAHRW